MVGPVVVGCYREDVEGPVVGGCCRDDVGIMQWVGVVEVVGVLLSVGIVVYGRLVHCSARVGIVEMTIILYVCTWVGYVV